MKARIIEHLGQADVLLPSLVAEGLAANDRIKVRLSVLQAAADHASDPVRSPADLTAECRSAGIDAAAVACLVSGARLSADGRVTAPNLIDLGKAILADLSAMTRAVAAGATGEGKAADDRLAQLRLRDRLASLDEISPTEIAQLTAVPPNGGDSLHRLVMDLHKALNRLAVDCAEEVVSGAHAYGLLTQDRSACQVYRANRINL